MLLACAADRALPPIPCRHLPRIQLGRAVRLICPDEEAGSAEHPGGLFAFDRCDWAARGLICQATLDALTELERREERGPAADGRHGAAALPRGGATEGGETPQAVAFALRLLRLLSHLVDEYRAAAALQQDLSGAAAAAAAELSIGPLRIPARAGQQQLAGGGLTALGVRADDATLPELRRTALASLLLSDLEMCVTLMRHLRSRGGRLLQPRVAAALQPLLAAVLEPASAAPAEWLNEALRLAKVLLKTCLTGTTTTAGGVRRTAPMMAAVPHLLPAVAPAVGMELSEDLLKAIEAAVADHHERRGGWAAGVFSTRRADAKVRVVSSLSSSSLLC